jgi:hypothetical protein
MAWELHKNERIQPTELELSVSPNQPVSHDCQKLADYLLALEYVSDR